ncbi:hypothetical protein NEDG_01696 [Nematocida displodere]|uniref:Uncharacterized protein n=1 Tax=Nematocida displodere TaxID=1805483 RepID=A0A177EDS4_9MICR|nr:hypothetical protein NEDG_01696 [Nematocida displodere]
MDDILQELARTESVVATETSKTAKPPRTNTERLFTEIDQVLSRVHASHTLRLAQALLTDSSPPSLPMSSLNKVQVAVEKGKKELEEQCMRGGSDLSEENLHRALGELADLAELAE